MNMDDKDSDLVAFTRMFAAWVRVLRERLGLTQVQLAEILRVRAEPISRWENGRELPTAPNVIRLLSLATPDERTALVEKGEPGLDDCLMRDTGTALEIVQCQECGNNMRVRDFTKRGWPAPLPLIRKANDPFAVKVCPTCNPMP